MIQNPQRHLPSPFTCPQTCHFLSLFFPSSSSQAPSMVHCCPLCKGIHCSFEFSIGTFLTEPSSEIPSHIMQELAAHPFCIWPYLGQLRFLWHQRWRKTGQTALAWQSGHLPLPIISLFSLSFHLFCILFTTQPFVSCYCSGNLVSTFEPPLHHDFSLFHGIIHFAFYLSKVVFAFCIFHGGACSHPLFLAVFAPDTPFFIHCIGLTFDAHGSLWGCAGLCPCPTLVCWTAVSHTTSYILSQYILITSLDLYPSLCSCVHVLSLCSCQHTLILSSEAWI